MQTAGNKTSHISPTRQRGNGLTPSLTLRVVVSSGSAEYKVHARRGEVAEEVLENRRGRLRGTALELYARQACRCAELGCSLVRHISISLPIEGTPASLGTWLGNREWERREFFEFSNTEVTFSNMSEEHRKNTKAKLALALAQGVTAAEWARTNDVTKMTAYGSAKDAMVRKAIEPLDQGSFNHGMRGMTRKRIKSKVAPPFPCSSVRSVVQVLEFLTPGRER